MMSKQLKFTVTTIWILFSRTYDAYCTSLYTPDLSKEANPLVSVLGFGWTSLIITLVVLSAMTIYAYYLSIFKPMDLLPKEKGYSFNHFIGYLYLGKKTTGML